MHNKWTLADRSYSLVYVPIKDSRGNLMPIANYELIKQGTTIVMQKFVNEPEDEIRERLYDLGYAEC